MSSYFGTHLKHVLVKDVVVRVQSHARSLLPVIVPVTDLIKSLVFFPSMSFPYLAVKVDTLLNVRFSVFELDFLILTLNFSSISLINSDINIAKEPPLGLPLLIKVIIGLQIDLDFIFSLLLPLFFIFWLILLKVLAIFNLVHYLITAWVNLVLRMLMAFDMIVQEHMVFDQGFLDQVNLHGVALFNELVGAFDLHT